MRLHVLGIPHAIHSLNFSHDAFMGKVLRFAKMMQMELTGASVFSIALNYIGFSRATLHLSFVSQETTVYGSGRISSTSMIDID